MNPKRIILTGATGLVGTAVLSRLIEDGHHIFAVSRHSQPPAPSQLEWLKADLKDGAETILSQVRDIDAVVHLAAAIGVPEGQDPARWYTKVNVDFSHGLFNGCTRVGIDTVVYASTVNFLRRPLEANITEEHPIELTNPYGTSKYEGERKLFAVAEGGAYRAVSLRLPSPISFNPHLLHRNVVKLWIEAAKRGDAICVYGAGSRTQNFVATVDIAEAVVLALETKDAHGVFNIASKTTLSMQGLAELIASRSGASVTHQGIDLNESERWEISSKKAGKVLGFAAKFDSSSAIGRLLDSVTW